ncbi:tetratricopeptide repeat protein [Microbulbifer sp. CAU 1566]|uniref:tetratricopeptide repeat protein n=1 Tax=Microbulbifer sp. CAU 1566 TaxID=2933269 RepID=UPI002004A42C|nr:tetratricopeptide repeat protein [Microbulbifer sp. CAU 1566]MCK7598344.1 tetratricopeptide repeat protein [Microbulbifer sp. CAU 1566]
MQLFFALSKSVSMAASMIFTGAGPQTAHLQRRILKPAKDLPPATRGQRQGLLVTAISAAILSACTQQPQFAAGEPTAPLPPPYQATTEQGEPGSVDPQTTSTTQPQAPADRQAGNREEVADARDKEKAKPFPIETFYTLLVAEVAGNREQYDLALANYYFQAERTKDAGVAARATRIARFLNARRAALRSAQLWVELEPENPDAQLAATAELTLAGEFESAMRHAELALDLGGDAPLQSVAATAVDNEELAAKVLPEFRRLSGKYPHNHEVSLALAMLLRANNKHAEALTLTRQVQEKDPALLDAPLLESHILIDMGREKEARKLLENLVALYPKESRLRLQYARLLIREDLDMAQQQFAELVKQRPNDGNLILSLALIQYETKQFDSAKAMLEKLLAMEEHESAAHFYLAGIAEQQGDVRQAVTHYHNVRPGSDYVQAITRGTALLAANGELDEAHKWFEELRHRHADQHEQFYLLQTELLTKHGYLKEAQTLLASAIEANSDSKRLIYAHAMTSDQLGDMANFELGLRKLLSRDPDNANLLNTLGYKLLSYDDRLNEALVLITKALELSPDDPAIIDSMGWAHHRLGNHSLAVEYLQKALGLMPDHEIAAHLGEALWALGERQQAMQVWEQGLQKNPESKLIPAAMQRLQDQQRLEQHVTES